MAEYVPTAVPPSATEQLVVTAVPEPEMRVYLLGPVDVFVGERRLDHHPDRRRNHHRPTSTADDGW
ncbi:MAG: hypothetical protein HND44_24295 [Chloroflexi bacterium]|nr:hypothetical protein [Ardenticatenaceae bacterium]NOG37659.1 hypothetical protein [Chloroflexota bacterium]